MYSEEYSSDAAVPKLTGKCGKVSHFGSDKSPEFVACLKSIPMSRKVVINYTKRKAVIKIVGTQTI